jgi:hypothetical protein
LAQWETGKKFRAKPRRARATGGKREELGKRDLWHKMPENDQGPPEYARSMAQKRPENNRASLLGDQWLMVKNQPLEGSDKLRTFSRTHYQGSAIHFGGCKPMFLLEK